MLVATDEGVAHARFRDLPAYLAPGDLVVVNNSATLAAEFDAVLRGRGTGRRARRDPARRRHLGGRAAHRARTPRAPSWTPRPGDELDLPGGRPAHPAVRPTRGRRPRRPGGGNRLWRAAVSGPRPLEQHLVRYGRPIAYGYLDRSYPLAAYQTVFATGPGSAEMPSAARPFTPGAGDSTWSRTGIGVAAITLHTGVSSQEAGEAPQPEWFEVSATGGPTGERHPGRGWSGRGRRHHRDPRPGVGRRRADGDVPVTATIRRRGLVARSGWTTRVVSRDDPPRVVTGLVTGWHDPEASHLLLVEAVAGQELTQRAYDEAARGGYLWHEFGDSALASGRAPRPSPDAVACRRSGLGSGHDPG